MNITQRLLTPIKKYLIAVKNIQTIPEFYKFIASPIILIFLVYYFQNKQVQDTSVPHLAMYILFSLMVLGLITFLFFILLALFHCFLVTMLVFINFINFWKFSKIKKFEKTFKNWIEKRIGLGLEINLE
jgi:hypothetical protein